MCELESFHPQHYIDGMVAAYQAGYDVLIVDSLSHAWAGKDGALELVDKARATGKDNQFTAWRHVTPLQHKLVDTMLRLPMHLIVTLRTKVAYVIEPDERGKQVPRSSGHDDDPYLFQTDDGNSKPLSLDDVIHLDTAEAAFLAQADALVGAWREVCDSLADLPDPDAARQTLRECLEVMSIVIDTESGREPDPTPCTAGFSIISFVTATSANMALATP